MRLNRYLASCGLGSRRSVETLIKEGRVKINGRIIDDLGTLVAPGDVVKVGSKIVQPEEIIHAVLFKPRGFLCTASDERARRTIFDLLPEDWPRVYHVGRLDMESDGLLIVTNDGDLSLSLTHPGFKIEKEYEVVIDKPFNPEHREKLLRGFQIEGGRAKMEELELLAPNKLQIILTQGIKRQIRLMLYECGYEVESLRRVRIGTLRIEKLRAGMWRMLSPKDVADLKAGRSPRRRAAENGPETDASTPIRSIPPATGRTMRPRRASDAHSEPRQTKAGPDQSRAPRPRAESDRPQRRFRRDA